MVDQLYSIHVRTGGPKVTYPTNIQNEKWTKRPRELLTHYETKSFPLLSPIMYKYEHLVV